MTLECKQCKMGFSNNNEAMYHLMMYHKEHLWKWLKGEFDS